MMRSIEMIGERNPLPDLGDEHSSMLLVRKNGDLGKLILCQYNSTYPKIDYRLRVNLIGGAEEKGDKNPKHTLERELNEEISFAEGNFAPEGFINSLREEVIRQVRYYGTFESFFLSYPNGLKRNYASIDTVYISDIDKEIFKKAEDFLRIGKSLVSEGSIGTFSLEGIREGDPLTAWDTGKIISDIYSVPIPNPDNVFCRRLKIGELEDYEKMRQLFSFK